MSQEKHYIAVDLGAESGRVMASTVSTDKFSMEEMHRFGNGPVEENGALKWDFEKLLTEIKAGIAKAVKRCDGRVEGIGVDSWGVDYGLFDENSNLLEKPYHYRDSRTDGVMEEVFDIVGKRQLYEYTGLQFIQLNTIYQLFAERKNNPEILERAKKLIFIADMVSYYLCGRAFGEYTLASTSGLMDMRTGQWCRDLFEQLSLPLDIMPDVIEAGTVVGKLTDEVAAEIGCEPIDVIATGAHDTASAVVGVPASDGRWAYFSSGTWSLIGVEVPNAVINDKTYSYPFTNEGGVENTIRLLKNIMGLWLVQESKRQWESEGAKLSYDEITEMAEKAKPFAGYVNPDDNRFYAPGDIPARVNSYLADTGQKTMDDKGQMTRILLESLAFKYRWVVDAIEEIMGNPIDCLHIVGGGIKNRLLCQFTADAVGKKVITGPVEATASGNILMQAKARGQLKSLQHIRNVIRNSFELKEYQPQDADIWQKQYEKIKDKLA